MFEDAKKQTTKLTPAKSMVKFQTDADSDTSPDNTTPTANTSVNTLIESEYQN